MFRILCKISPQAIHHSLNFLNWMPILSVSHSAGPSQSASIRRLAERRPLLLEIPTNDPRTGVITPRTPLTVRPAVWFLTAQENQRSYQIYIAKKIHVNLCSKSMYMYLSPDLRPVLSHLGHRSPCPAGCLVSHCPRNQSI